MKKCLEFFKRFDIPASTRSFGLFRIFYTLYNIGLIIQLFLNWPVYFDSIAPFSSSYFPAKLTMLVWLITNFFLLTGTFTRYAAAVNYGLVVLMTACFANIGISSFNDDLLRIGGFLLIFMPAGRSFSVDAFFNRMVNRNVQQTTSYLYYLLTILVSLGLLYLGSGFTKLFSPMWQQGIGLWIPAVTPSYKWNAFSFFVDNRVLMYFLNYFVIVFELLFVVLLFQKKTHPFLALIGIGFHLGIAFLFPFPYISFGPIFYYVLMIPDTFWNRIQIFVQSKEPLKIYYNPSIPKHLHAAYFLQSGDLRKNFIFEETHQTTMSFGDQSGWNGFLAACRKSILLFPAYVLLSIKDLRNVASYASENWLPQVPVYSVSSLPAGSFGRFAFFVFITGLCGVQVLTLGYHTYSTIKADRQKLNTYFKQKIAVQDFSTKPANLARTFFGINSRGLFLDHAFSGSKTVFALARLSHDGSENWLPVFSKEGYCENGNIGFMWHKLTFRYFGKSKTQPDTLGLKKYTWLWAKKCHVPVNDLQIRVYRRIYPCPTVYEKGYLDKMLNLTWDTVGIIHWKDSIFSYENLMPDSTFTR